MKKNRKVTEGFDSRYPFRAHRRYENATCGACAEAERKAAERGRDVRAAVCPACATRRNVSDPSIGARL